MKLSKTNLNIVYLYVLRIVMYIFPLITLPLLVRVLGVSNYGVLSLIQAVTNYFVLFINYGFNFSATRNVAKSSNDQSELNKIFTYTFFSKLVLLGCSVPIIVIIGGLLPLLRNNFFAYLMLIFMLVNEVVFPIYFFQGMENMKIVTVINLFTRFIGLIFIIIFVKQQNDLVLALFITNISTLAGGIFGFWYSKKLYHLKFVKINKNNILSELKDGWDFFLAQGMSTMLSNSNVLILGVFLSASQVGYYSIAEKIMRMAASFVSPISNAIYPVAVKKFQDSLNQGLSFLKKYLLAGTVIFGLGSVMLFTFAPLIVKMINGSSNNLININLKIIAVIPLSIFVNNIYGTQIQLQINRKRQFRNLIIYCGCLLPILTIILLQFIPNVAASISLLISELSLMFLMVIDVELVAKKGFLTIVTLEE